MLIMRFALFGLLLVSVTGCAARPESRSAAGRLSKQGRSQESHGPSLQQVLDAVGKEVPKWRNRDKHFREVAELFVKRTDPDRAIPFLLPKLSDVGSGHSHVAMHALIILRDRRVEVPLKELLKHEDAGVRWMAQHVLESLREE